MERWAVIQIETNNGLRIGITEENVIGEEMTILLSNLSAIESNQKSIELSSKLNTPQFNNNIDIY